MLSNSCIARYALQFRKSPFFWKLAPTHWFAIYPAFHWTHVGTIQSSHQYLLLYSQISSLHIHQRAQLPFWVLVGWFAPPLSWDGGMEKTTIQIHPVNLTRLGKGKSGISFRNRHECKLVTDSPTTNRADCHRWLAKNRFLRLAG